jgi:hypothetical protein
MHNTTHTSPNDRHQEDGGQPEKLLLHTIIADDSEAFIQEILAICFTSMTPEELDPRNALKQTINHLTDAELNQIKQAIETDTDISQLLDAMYYANIHFSTAVSTEDSEPDSLLWRNEAMNILLHLRESFIASLCASGKLNESLRWTPQRDYMQNLPDKESRVILSAIDLIAEKIKKAGSYLTG